MKAVLHEIGGIPRYEDFPDPVAGDDEVVIDVKAVAVENVDKRIAAGTHYASRQYTTQLPAIPAFDGIGALPDGTLVGFGNPRRPYGALAEKTVVPKGAYMPIAEVSIRQSRPCWARRSPACPSRPPLASCRARTCSCRAPPESRGDSR